MGRSASHTKRPNITNTNINLEPNRKQRKLITSKRLPQLPFDVVGLIVKHLGIRALGAAAQVSRTWRDAVEENGLEIWRGHCARINAIPYGDQLATLTLDRTQLNDERACEGARKKLAYLYRLTYFQKRHTVCAHCLSGEARDYPLYGIRLCVQCMRKEPYAWIRRSTASRHFRFGKTLHMDPAKPLFSMPIRGKHFGRKSDGPLYRFADILRLSRAKFGEEFTNNRANVVRTLCDIGRMRGEHFKDI